MNSPPAVLLGNQIPTFEHVPDRVATWNDADDALFLAASYEFVPDPWQHGTCRSWMGVRADGKWAASRCGLAVGRQNGKTGALEPRILYGMKQLGERFLYSAHEQKTARKMLERLLFYYDNPRRFPRLNKEVRTIRQTNSQEAIVLKNGGSIEFVARTRGSGRGYAVDVLLCDEAQELNEVQLAALQPTNSASLNRQSIFMGTPPGEGIGNVFAKIRDDALAHRNPRLAWREWGCDADVDLDDPEIVRLVNPGYGYRLDDEALADDRTVMSDATYMREHLGCWTTDKLGAQRVIDALTWGACGNPLLVDAGGEVALAIDTSPDRLTTSVVGAARTVTGLPYLDVLESRSGAPNWAAKYVAGICGRQNVRAVVIDGQSPAMTLVEPLRAEGIAVTITTARQMIIATGQLYDAIHAVEVLHLDQIALNMAMSAARKRKIGMEGGWGWNRVSPDTDITPVVGGTLALWGLTSSEVADKPKKRTGTACFA